MTIYKIDLLKQTLSLLTGIKKLVESTIKGYSYIIKLTSLFNGHELILFTLNNSILILY